VKGRCRHGDVELWRVRSLFEVLEGVRCVMLCMLEAVEVQFCLPDVLDGVEGAGGCALCAALYVGGVGSGVGSVLFAGGTGGGECALCNCSVC
jgi:hypothetical protein